MWFKIPYDAFCSQTSMDEQTLRIVDIGRSVGLSAIMGQNLVVATASSRNQYKFLNSWDSILIHADIVNISDGVELQNTVPCQ